MRILTIISVVFVFSLFAIPAQADLARAQELFEQGRVQEALSEIEKLLQTSPQDAEGRFLQGIIYADLGNSTRAIEIFAGLTEDYPELPEPYNNLAVLFAEQGEFEKARDSLMAAIQTHPSYSTAHENLGDLYAKMAGIAYDRALEEDRRNQSARLKLSAVNGLFSAPGADRVAQAETPPPQQQLPEIIQSEPIPEIVAAVAKPQPDTTQTRPSTSQPTSQPATQPAPTTVAMVDKPETQSTPTAAPAVASESTAIRSAVTRWANAWSNQNFDGYIAAYAPSFRPANGASRASWVTYRRGRLAAPSFIDVEVGDIDIEMTGADRARASFVQGYRSDNYQDKVIKTLTLQKTSSGWQITSEVSEAI